MTVDEQGRDRRDEVLDVLANIEERSFDAIAMANPHVDIETAADVYALLLSTEPQTYELTLELNEYELMHLIDRLQRPLCQKMARGDHSLAFARTLREVVEETPDHFDRLEELQVADGRPGEDGGDDHVPIEIDGGDDDA